MTLIFEITSVTARLLLPILICQEGMTFILNDWGTDITGLSLLTEYIYSIFTNYFRSYVHNRCSQFVTIMVLKILNITY